MFSKLLSSDMEEYEEKIFITKKIWWLQNVQYRTLTDKKLFEHKLALSIGHG